MEERDNQISYFALEGIMTHYTVTIKRLLCLCVTILVLWFSTIIGFLWYISLPVEEGETVKVESDGGYANYVGNDVIGGINNGESENNNK